MSHTIFKIGDKVTTTEGFFEGYECVVNEIHQGNVPSYKIKRIDSVHQETWAPEDKLKYIPRLCGFCESEKVYSTKRQEYICPFCHVKQSNSVNPRRGLRNLVE